jgi:hypothetical protein
VFFLEPDPNENPDSKVGSTQVIDKIRKSRSNWSLGLSEISGHLGVHF